MKDLQDLVISQMLSVFHPKGNAMEYWCPWSTSLLTPSALLELEYNCQVTEAAMYNNTGSLPLEEMESSVLISFLVWLSKRKKKKLGKFSSFLSESVDFLLPPLFSPCLRMKSLMLFDHGHTGLCRECIRR